VIASDSSTPRRRAPVRPASPRAGGGTGSRRTGRRRRSRGGSAGCAAGPRGSRPSPAQATPRRDTAGPSRPGLESEAPTTASESRPRPRPTPPGSAAAASPPANVPGRLGEGPPVARRDIGQQGLHIRQRASARLRPEEPRTGQLPERVQLRRPLARQHRIRRDKPVQATCQLISHDRQTSAGAPRSHHQDQLKVSL
jgi:hypothetical protein